MTEHVIDLERVEKTYRGKIRALDGISMRVHAGEVFGLLGPNGAGKSTLVKILMTVIRPSRVRGTMLGRPVGDKATLARVGYLPEHHRFPGYLKGAQVLDFYGAMAGVPRRQRRTRSAKLLELVGMTRWAGTSIGRYSKGMRQRVGLAQALMNDPAIVLLDEPTDGVDPQGRRDIRAICQRLAGEGRTVFLNSHLLSELEMICDRVAILVQGRVRRQGTIDELTADQRRYEIELETEPEGWTPPEALPTGEAVTRRGGLLVAATPDARRVRPLIETLVSRGAVLKRVTPHRPSLEDLFMQAVTDDEGRELEPGAAAKNGAPRR